MCTNTQISVVDVEAPLKNTGRFVSMAIGSDGLPIMAYYSVNELRVCRVPSCAQRHLITSLTLQCSSHIAAMCNAALQPWWCLSTTLRLASRMARTHPLQCRQTVRRSLHFMTRSMALWRYVSAELLRTDTRIRGRDVCAFGMPWTRNYLSVQVIGECAARPTLPAHLTRSLLGGVLFR